MNARVYQQITERIITLLTQGTVPWHKPWKARTGLPRSFVTKRPYRGVNVVLLLTLHYESPFWLTFRQALQLGGNVVRASCLNQCSWKFNTKWRPTRWLCEMARVM